MLMFIDRMLCRSPSMLINFLTCGPRGSSLCGRMWLRKQYGDGGTKVTLFLIQAIDLIELNHCYKSATLWRRNVERKGLPFPDEYKKFFNRCSCNPSHVHLPSYMWTTKDWENYHREQHAKRNNL